MEDNPQPMSETADVTEWYTGPELAQVLGITRQRVGQLRMAGKLTGGIQRGGTWFYPRGAVQEYHKLHSQN